MAQLNTNAGFQISIILQHLDVRNRCFHKFVIMIPILINCVDIKLVIILNIVTSTTVVVMSVMTLVSTVAQAAMITISALEYPAITYHNVQMEQMNSTVIGMIKLNVRVMLLLILLI